MSVNFFLYDVPKVLILLAVVIFFVAIIRSFFPPEKTRKILSHSKLYGGNVAAALLGIVTPFCSCSAVPLFIGFVESGVPLGVTFSFLVASPMINEVAIILLGGMFGWKIALLYIVVGTRHRDHERHHHRQARASRAGSRSTSTRSAWATPESCPSRRGPSGSRTRAAT